MPHVIQKMLSECEEEEKHVTCFSDVILCIFCFLRRYSLQDDYLFRHQPRQLPALIFPEVFIVHAGLDFDNSLIIVLMMLAAIFVKSCDMSRSIKHFILPLSFLLSSIT